MNAKELIEAATNYRSWSLPHGHPEKGFCAWLLSDVETARRHRDHACEAMADHILSTVRPNDDEPVTRDGMYKAEGWGFDPLEQEWGSLTINGVSVSFEDDDEAFLWTGSFYTPLKNMGHLRRLVAALGGE